MVWTIHDVQVLISNVYMETKTNGADLTGCLHKEECKSTFSTLNKAQFQVDQEPQHNTGYT